MTSFPIRCLAFVVLVAFKPAESIFASDSGDLNKLLFDMVQENGEPEAPDAAGPCCGPRVLQGTIHLHHPSSSYPHLIKFYVDAPNSRAAYVPSQRRRNRTVVYCQAYAKICRLYQIDEVARRCTRTYAYNSTIDNFWDRCVPQGASLTKRTTLGASVACQQSAMSVQHWEYSGKYGQRFVKIVSDDGCVPVAEVVTMRSPIGHVARATAFYFDASTTIADPTVFKLPMYCGYTEEEGEK